MKVRARAKQPWTGLFVLLLVVSGAVQALAWSVGHNDSSWLAATISPEPFASNPDLCMYAHYADSMQDHAVGHGRDGYLRRLFTLEAIDVLRSGDLPEGLLLASAATHYLTDRACIAHAGHAWYHKPDDQWTKFLPRRWQPVAVPSERREIYYPHLKGTARDTVLVLPEPEYAAETWRKFQGSTNAYFDSLPGVRKYVGTEMLRSPVDWTFTDLDEYCRWYATFISLDMLDPASVKDGPLRLRGPQGMKAVCIDELLNGAHQVAGFYSYVATAVETRVDLSLERLLSDHDKLLQLAPEDPVVVLPRSAPWAMERAAHVLAMELMRAGQRLAVTRNQPRPDRDVSSFVVRVPADELGAVLGSRSAIVMLAPGDDDWSRIADPLPVPEGKRGLIAARRTDAGNLHILLNGATMQDTLHLVDYLLDITWAPVHGRWPAEKIVEFHKGRWTGWRLIADLRQMSGQVSVDHARKVPYHHNDTRTEDSQAYDGAFKAGVYPGGSEEEWWGHFLLELPLPDGSLAADMIERGNDYSELEKLAQE